MLTQEEYNKAKEIVNKFERQQKIPEIINYMNLVPASYNDIEKGKMVFCVRKEEGLSIEMYYVKERPLIFKKNNLNSDILISMEGIIECKIQLKLLYILFER